MAWRIYNSVMPLLGVELFRGARDRHAALAFLLLPVHVESKREGALAQSLSLFLQFEQLTLGKASELKNEPTSCGALAAVDVAADHDGEVLFLRVGRHAALFTSGQPMKNKTMP